MKNFSKYLALFILTAFFAGACVTGPYNNADVANYDSVVKFQGYLFSNGESVTVQVKNKNTGVWEDLGNAVSGVQAQFNVAAGAFMNSDNPDMYYYVLDKKIATAGNPSSWCRWSSTCSKPDSGVHTAEVRIKYQTFTLQTFESTGITCVIAQINGGETFINSSVNCKSPASPILTLHTNN